MPNLGEFYAHSGWPATNASGDSSSARSELDTIVAAFNKLPALAGFGLKLVRVTATANGLEAVSAATAQLETYADAQGWAHNKLANVAGTNTITATASPTLAAYVQDQIFIAEAAGANTGAVTINVDAVGARNLLNADGTALEAGDIPAAGYPMVMQVRSTDVVLLNPYHSVKPQVHAAPSKATPADTDELPLLDNASSFLLSKLTWANLKTAIQSFLADLLERPGFIKDWGGSVAPSGYLVCNGAAVSRTTYANLFTAIGTTWGAGDGSTTFNVPNIPGGYTTYNANPTVGLSSAGQVISHTHSIHQPAATGTGPYLNPWWAALGTNNGYPSPDPTTSATGGGANFAAGVAVLKVIKT